MDIYKNKNRHGFTIIELVVVIAIIAVLSAIVMVNVSSYTAKSRDAKRIEDLQNIKKALELYFVDNGFYPPSPCGYNCNGLYISNNSNWQTLETYLKPYISSLPKDPITSPACWPLSNSCYFYAYGYTLTNLRPYYDLFAKLEDPNNPLACKFKCYKFWYNGTPWCQQCGGLYSDSIYALSP